MLPSLHPAATGSANAAAEENPAKRGAIEAAGGSGQVNQAGKSADPVPQPQREGTERTHRGYVQPASIT